MREDNQSNENAENVEIILGTSNVLMRRAALPLCKETEEIGVYDVG